MKFITDLHVHSKYSRVTAKNLDLENLYIAGQLKGITVLGTGDVTHPAWFSEIKEKLVPAEAGLFKLREEIARVCNSFISEKCQGTIRFVLVSEISSIYKKNGKTRKNHNLVFFPEIESVEKFNKTLDNIGNIKSDGRPILGLHDLPIKSLDHGEVPLLGEAIKRVRHKDIHVFPGYDGAIWKNSSVYSPGKRENAQAQMSRF